MNFPLIHIDETDSTNRWLSAYHGQAEGEDIAVWTDYQTAGRGCGSNRWESERGRNLLFSVLYHPKGVPAADQFILSMANALALRDALSEYADGVKIKWPNDIYWHDRKLCGTLIESTMRGHAIGHTIIGTGINVNQQRFVSDAPNPVSLFQILQQEVDRERLLQEVLQRIGDCLRLVEEGDWELIRTRYRQHLYRLGEDHSFRWGDREECCRLLGVSDDGHLLLLPLSAGDREPLSFAFKEVQFVI
jgi:BirA family biotin operon repressor/biotin-[acetyl-CoA-carboxylase] ligase